jgi:hypothetical protein
MIETTTIKKLNKQLQKASKIGDLEKIMDLITKGADPTDNNSHTPLYSLDFYYRTHSDPSNLKKIESLIEVYPKEGIKDLLRKNLVNLCIGTKKIIKDHTRQVILKDIKKDGLKDAINLYR